MGRQYEVGLAGDAQLLVEHHTGILQLLCLLGEEDRVEHHAVTDDIDRPALEDSRRHRSQDMGLPLDLQRVTGIGSALEATDDIVVGGQHIDHLSLSLIAPLQSQQDIYLIIHSSVSIIYLTISVSTNIAISPLFHSQRSPRGRKTLSRTPRCLLAVPIDLLRYHFHPLILIVQS